MEVLRRKSELSAWLSERRGVPRVLVPTMGALHRGHTSLFDLARREAAARGGGEVVATIFVNPTQFGPNEDFAAYPRPLEADLAKCREHGVDAVFAPAAAEVYAADRSVTVTETRLSARLCGASRPGHFDGVCTVVAKLFHLTRPDAAVFGEKDYQQLAIIRRMHADLFLSGEVVGMPIVREPDGLAMSSRNANLSPDARRDALAISRFLAEVRRRFAAGERDASRLVAGAHEALAPGRIDYVEVVDAADLAPVTVVERPVLVAVAAHFGGVRLIDNTVLA